MCEKVEPNVGRQENLIRWGEVVVGGGEDDDDEEGRI